MGYSTLTGMYLKSVSTLRARTKETIYQAGAGDVHGLE
jgi:hypothetical protein